MVKKTSGRKVKSVPSQKPKVSYVRLSVPLVPEETAPFNAQFDFVRSLNNATRFSPFDAEYFKRRASEGLPPAHVEIEEVGEGKYVLRRV